MSSFKKFSSSAPSQPTKSLPSGCKFNLSNLPVTSSGIAPLDSLFADGIPIGTLVAIREDSPSNYWQVICKLFVAQGLAANQRIFISSLNNVQCFVSELPSLSGSSRSEQVNETREKLTIAWRYQNLPTVSNNNAGHSDDSFYFHFDLSSSTDQSTNPNITTCASNQLNSVLEEIRNIIKSAYDARISLSNPQESRHLLRILIAGLGSLPWNLQNETFLYEFLLELRAILRHSYAVCYLSFPNWIYSKRKIFSFMDCCLSLDTAGVGKADDFHGFLRVDKPFRIGSFSSNIKFETREFVFRCKKHKFVIEKYHLPPELGEEPSRFSSGCVSSKMDF